MFRPTPGRQQQQSSDRRGDDIPMVYLACVAIALAAWLVPASIHIVGWDGAAPSRVAFLAPWSRLGVYVLAGLLAARMLVSTVARLGARWAEGLATVCAPVTLLYVWGVPYIPFVVDGLPLALVFSGPARWLVLPLVAIGSGVAAMSLVTSARPFAAWRPLWAWRDRAPSRRWVFAMSVVVLTAVGGFVKSSQGVGGDEPHYLVIAHSLMSDGDLRIENNHEARHFDAYWPGPLPPHFIQRGVDDVIYSIHAPGLPALLVPLYSIGGQWGAMVGMTLLGSLAATSIFGVSRRLTTPWIAVTTWVAVVFTIPFAPQSWLVYPEMGAAVVMAWFVVWMFEPLPRRAVVWLGRGAAVGFLPWLHTKYSLMLAGMAVCLLLKVLAPLLWSKILPGEAAARRRERVADAAAFLTPMVVSGLAWFSSFYVMYGTPDPTVAYGSGGQTELELANFPRGTLGLLFDQEFGLLIYSPIYALVPLGLWVLLRHRDTRWPTLGVLAASCGLLLSVVPYYMWWGGGSAPARFLVPIVPAAALMISAAVAHWRQAVARGMMGMLGLVSVVSSIVAVARPGDRLLFNDRDGTGRLVEALQGGIDMTVSLPTFIASDWVNQVPLVAAWVVAAGVAASITWRSGRQRSDSRGAFWSGVVFLGLFAGAGMVLDVVIRGDRVAAETVRHGREDALEAYDPPRVHAFAYRGGRVAALRDPELFRLATMRQDVTALPPVESGPPMERRRAAGPYSLPAGRHIVRVWVDQRRAGSRGQIWVAYHRTPVPLVVAALTRSNPVELVLDLPVNLTSLWIGATNQSLVDAITDVQIDAVSLVPRSRRLAFGNVQYAAKVDAQPGRYALHADDNVFIEEDGFWVRGERTAVLRVSPVGASALRLTVRNAAAAGTVDIDVDGRRSVLELAARESREVTVNLLGDEDVVTVSVAPAGGFRPVDGGASQDTRLLGCRVRLAFEDSP